MTQAPDLEGIDPIIQKAMEGLPADFADFPRIFQNDIRPALASQEAARVRAADRAKKSTLLGGLIGIGGVLLSLFAIKVPQLAIVAGFLGFGIAGAGRAPLGRIGRDAKTMIVEPIARHLALDFIPTPSGMNSVYDHKRVGLLPGWDRSAYEDQIIGSRNGIDFEFFEAHLEERRTSTDSQGRLVIRWSPAMQVFSIFWVKSPWAIWNAPAWRAQSLKKHLRSIPPIRLNRGSC